MSHLISFVFFFPKLNGGVLFPTTTPNCELKDVLKRRNFSSRRVEMIHISKPHLFLPRFFFHSGAEYLLSLV